MGEPCQPGEVEVRAGAGSKRVTAPKPLFGAGGGVPGAPRSLLQKELLGAKPGCRELLCRSFDQFRLQREWSVSRQHDTQHQWWPPFNLRRPGAVREVLAAEGLVVALADSGVCTAFDQDSGEQLCFLNAQADEVIRSLFINASATIPTLITVSTYSTELSQCLKVRSTPLSGIRSGQAQPWRPLFPSEVLCWPGFVEFDDVHNVVVTCCASSRRYKVWDLRCPFSPLFYVGCAGVSDFKVSSGAILLTMQTQPHAHAPPQQQPLPQPQPLPESLDLQQTAQQKTQPTSSSPGASHCLPLRILDLRDGSCVQELSIPCGAGGSMELVELFGRHLLSKAPGCPLRITDVVTGACLREVQGFPAPTATIHLPFNACFVAFWDDCDAQLWSLGGERLATLARAALPPTGSSNCVFVSNSQDLMFVYCPPSSGSGNSSGVANNNSGIAAAAAAAAGAGTATGGSMVGSAEGQGERLGCIRVYCLLTGRQVAVVRQRHPRQTQQDAASCQRTAVTTTTAVAPAAAAAPGALAHVSGLFYDETAHCVYVGTEHGRVQAWAV